MAGRIFFVELSPIVLIHLLHAQPDPVREQLQHLNPNEKTLFHYFSDVISYLLTDLTRVNNCGKLVLDVEYVHETTHFVDLGHFTFVYMVGL
jgi:hypothetical protein